MNQNRTFTPQNTPGVRRSEKRLIGQCKNLPLRGQPTTLNEWLKTMAVSFKQQTINPFYKISLKEYSIQYSLYLRLLTHFFTLLYQNNRIMENKCYVTTREDVIAALQLLESMGLQQERKEQLTKEQLLNIIDENFGKDPFTARELQQVIGIAKTTTHSYLQLLLKQNAVVRTGYKNRGYRYCIQDSS